MTDVGDCCNSFTWIEFALRRSQHDNIQTKPTSALSCQEDGGVREDGYPRQIS
jgi:hypothetical protein